MELAQYLVFYRAINGIDARRVDGFGGQADWNVSADTDTNGVKQEINKDRMQWSVHAGAGLEFCPIPLLGLYAEPGIKYYFDNGSNVQNYFKDKPLNLNVQLGIRINF